MGQFSGTLMLLFEVKVPGEQGMHEELPGTKAYDPKSTKMGVLKICGEQKIHMNHTYGKSHLPASHKRQSFWLSAPSKCKGMYVPLLHRVHSLPSSLL